MIALDNSLSNVQIELLKLYSNNIKDDQLKEIKLLLGNYFARKATEAMDKTWRKNNLSVQDMTDWTHEHNRR